MPVLLARAVKTDRPSQRYQNFIEDCEICCNPIDFQILIKYNEIDDFQIKKNRSINECSKKT